MTSACDNYTPIIPVVIAPTEAKAMVDALIDEKVDITDIRRFRRTVLWRFR